jgi:hypothetical protein
VAIELHSLVKYSLPMYTHPLAGEDKAMQRRRKDLICHVASFCIVQHHFLILHSPAYHRARTCSISSPQLILLLSQISQTHIIPNSNAKKTFMNVRSIP